MSERITLFAEVILPLPLPSTYTYRIPFEWNELVKKRTESGCSTWKQKRFIQA